MKEMREIVRQAEQAAPKEVCGALVRNPDHTVEVVQLENVHEGGDDRFRPRMTMDLVKRYDQIVAFYHTHLQDPMLSAADIEACEDIGVPYYVVSATRDQVCSYAPRPAPLLDRPYVWGLFDCCTLIRDAWTLAGGEAPLQRHPTPREWKDRVFSFDTLLTQYGFEPVDSPDSGDVLLFKQNTGACRPHSALILEGGMLLEHALGECSRRRPIGPEDFDQPHGIYRCASPSISTALSRICTTPR